MSAYQSTLLGRTKVAEDTMARRFRKAKSFVFKVSQCIDLTLLGSALSRPHGLTHTFSIASVPSAEDLVVTTPYAIQFVSAPCRFCPSVQKPESTAPWAHLLFVTIQRGQLCYSPPELGSLHSLASVLTVQRKGSGILFFCSMQIAISRMPRLWMHCGSGLISGFGLFLPSRALSRKITRDGRERPEHGAICYIAGPPTMVQAACRTLGELGIDEDDIRTDEFAGY